MSALRLSVTAMLLTLAGCSLSNSRVVTRLNEDAAVTDKSFADPLQWKVVTSGVNPHSSMMYTLFGNDAATNYARTSNEQNYPDGSVLSLVTWQQQEDSRWFGGKIPGQLNPIEFVAIQVSKDGKRSYSYRDYEGSPLQERSSFAGNTERRVAYFLSQRAAVMPKA